VSCHYTECHFAASLCVIMLIVILLKGIMLIVILLKVTVESHWAECHYTEFLWADCRGAKFYSEVVKKVADIAVDGGDADDIHHDSKFEFAFIKGLICDTQH